MEKKINKFEDTAMVVIKNKPLSRIEQWVEDLCEEDYCSLDSFLPKEYTTVYDLYINGKHIEGDYLWISRGYDDRIINNDTRIELTKDNILDILESDSILLS